MAADRSNISRGSWGERVAATEYERRGFEVVARNWRSPTGEIDLVVRRTGLYVFSEVKTRRTDHYGPAALAVGEPKQRRIRRLAVEWLRANDVHAAEIRFDVVAITGVRVDVIEAAF
ncbi:MAG: YraN family protein [Ilumatobacteraceae bacterium]